MATTRLKEAEQISAMQVGFDSSWLLDLGRLPLENLSSGFGDPNLSSIFMYKVPKLTPDDTCSRALEPEPFDLHRALTGRAFEPATADTVLAQRLLKLGSVVRHIASCTSAEWVGIYRVIPSDTIAYPVLVGSSSTLVKEAYVGAPSRPFFPLTAEFAAKSNNSTVGLSGDAIVIQDTRCIDDDTPYYSCDGKVRSELCAPIRNDSGKIIGIMDVEAFAPGFFTPERVSLILNMCSRLGAVQLFC